MEFLKVSWFGIWNQGKPLTRFEIMSDLSILTDLLIIFSGA